jgi:hypothetical protein
MTHVVMVQLFARFDCNVFAAPTEKVETLMKYNANRMKAHVRKLKPLLLLYYRNSCLEEKDSHIS